MFKNLKGSTEYVKDQFIVSAMKAKKIKQMNNHEFHRFYSIPYHFSSFGERERERLGDGERDRERDRPFSAGINVYFHNY